MKRDREGDSMQHPFPKKQKLNNNRFKLIDNEYEQMETNNEQIAPISQISLTTNKQITTKNGRVLKCELHPTKTNTTIINLVDSSAESTDSDSSDSSIKTASPDLYRNDGKGYLVFVEGLSILNKYKLVKQLGKGTFSRVFECYKVKHNDTNQNRKQKDSKPQKYAIKVIRNVYKYQMAAEMELEILRKIRDNDANQKSCCIHLVENNQYRGHPVFVFPLLGKSIYSFMVQNGYKPFCFKDAIHIMYQICCGVQFMHSLNIIITDLKPENIVLVNDEIDSKRPINSQIYVCPKRTQIRLIDFGSAVNQKRNKIHKHLIQTRHYRAPEVVFKLPWTFSADLWSVGCILVELVYGKMIFNTHCSIDHLNQMVKCIDAPSSDLLQLIDDDTWDDFFDSRGALNMHKAKRSPVQCKKLEKYFVDKNINNDCAQMYDLCRKLLKWNPKDRLTAKQALRHPVFNKM